MKTVSVIGATGMVGSALVKLLLADNSFSNIIVFSRRSLPMQHEKLRVHIIDFNKPDTWQHLVQGDVLFSALGTTLKQAGSKEAQYKIDYAYQLDFAKAASLNRVATYVLVSSASANPDSKIFYTRMKGELERDVKTLPFKNITIIQPSLLVGKRNEKRIGEKIGYHILHFFNAIGTFKKYRPIGAETVAKAMINASMKSISGIHIYSLDEIFALAGERGR